MKYCVLIFFISLLSVGCLNKKTEKQVSPIAKKPKESFVFNTLFKNGENGYACYRIPAVVTTINGTVLAFSEARKAGCSDTGYRFGNEKIYR